jgi:NAD(P) transhydrogenase subunit alpha
MKRFRQWQRWDWTLLVLFLASSGSVWAAQDDSSSTTRTAQPLAEVSNAGDTEMVAAADAVDETAASAGGLSRSEALIASVTIFALSVFVGFEIITKVPPTLHTPLMSGSNAISGITLVGAVLTAGSGKSDLAAFLGLSAVILATINAVGGFLVTDRMLEMFQKKK